MPKYNRTTELKIRAFDAEERLAKAQATIREQRDTIAELRKQRALDLRENNRLDAIADELRQNALLVGGFMTNVVDALLDIKFAKFHTNESADYIVKVINEATRLNARETTT